MEHNDQNFGENSSFDQKPTQLKEKNGKDGGTWSWIITLLVLGLLAWFGYTSGWFTPKSISDDFIDVPIESVDYGVSDELAQIDNMTIETISGFPVQKVLVLKGNLLNGCKYLNDPQVIRDGSTFFVNLTVREEGEVCTEALVPYERNIALDVVGLPSGVYIVNVNGKETTFELEQENIVDFTAGEDK